MVLEGRRAPLGVDAVAQYDDDHLRTRHDNQGRAGEAGMPEAAGWRAAHKIWSVEHPAQATGEMQFRSMVSGR